MMDLQTIEINETKTTTTTTTQQILKLLFFMKTFCKSSYHISSSKISCRFKAFGVTWQRQSKLNPRSLMTWSWESGDMATRGKLKVSGNMNERKGKRRNHNVEKRLEKGRFLGFELFSHKACTIYNISQLQKPNPANALGN